MIRARRSSLKLSVALAPTQISRAIIPEWNGGSCPSQPPFSVLLISKHHPISVAARSTSSRFAPHPGEARSSRPLPCKTQMPSLLPRETQAIPPPRFPAAVLNPL
ncbi:hypothetical protein TIFTF001_034983 [Ficus carica]|uniref:Uncharacterized protein n=1 Tax=Ficus carica TaxID=3494 RepID=A0AA88J9P0_FICCA|nr:hypothetical protein TIFTF001_034983 [Ficus carica]